MPNYTIQDLAWMKGVPVPVREALFSLEQQLAAAQDREAELTAHVERLRGDLKLIKYETDIHGNKLNKPIHTLTKEALASTPAQSLARLRNEVLEEAVKVCEQANTAGSCIAAIRELKEPE